MVLKREDLMNLGDSNCNDGRDDLGRPCKDTQTLMNLLKKQAKKQAKKKMFLY
jgi:hypothetical protein